jgi:hypothetical protein
MKCTVCDKKLNVFSKELNSFNKQLQCPFCKSDVKMGLNWKPFLLYAIVGAIVIAAMNSILFHSSLFKLAGNAVVVGVAIIQGLELKKKNPENQTEAEQETNT